MRAGELAALRWEDVDLEHDTIHVHRSIDKVNGGTKGTKTDTGRRIPIEPGLKPLLQAMYIEAGGRGLVFKMPSEGSRSRKVKMYLRRAGVTRAELFVRRDDKTRKALSFHDLRSTGITWMTLRATTQRRCVAGRATRPGTPRISISARPRTCRQASASHSLPCRRTCWVMARFWTFRLPETRDLGKNRGAQWS
jgi:hypothetical protein